jgi:ribosomal protein S18 acetylase RimI-like enzyme
VAYQDDQPISSLTLFLDKKVASFYNVGTLPAHRGKGLGTMMTLYSLDIAQKKGYTWATLQANTNSVSMYSRMGFRSLIDYWLCFK